jgi:hypothetical protein
MLAFDQGDLAAQRLERLGHLDADWTAADDDHAPGDLLGGRRVAARPQALNLLEPFVGGDQGHRAAGQDHRPPGFELLVPDHDIHDTHTAQSQAERPADKPGGRSDDRRRR